MASLHGLMQPFADSPKLSLCHADRYTRASANVLLHVTLGMASSYLEIESGEVLDVSKLII
jgi:hypothetical protein